MKILDRIAILAAALLVASCAQRDITVTTNVGSDGSCVRTVTFRGDSSVFVAAVGSDDKGALLSLDDWEKNWSIDNGKTFHSFPMSSAQYDSIVQEFRVKGCKTALSDTVLLCAVRNFNSVESMALSQPLQIAGTPLKAQSSFDREFRWFYTYYTFSETFEPLINKYPLPIENYLSPEVALFWFTGSPNLMQGYTPSEFKDKLDAMQKDVERWLSACWIAIYYDAIALYYDNVTDAPVDRETFIANRDALLKKLPYEQGVNLFDNTLSCIDEYYGTNAYRVSLKDDSLFNEYLERQCQFIFDISSLNARYNLIMPGTIVDAGNGVLREGGVVEYPLTGSRLIPQEYTIYAVSRKLNIWSVVATVLCLLSVGWFIVRKRK